MPLERNICVSIDRLLRTYPDLWSMKVHGSPMQRAGVPDYLILYRGKTLFIEVKRPGEQPTKIQEFTMDGIGRTGAAFCHVVTSAAELRTILMKIDGVT